MNYQEYLFDCLSEELAESIVEAVKCNRFAPDGKFEGYEHTNLERLEKELSDVEAIKQMLAEEGIHLQIDWIRVEEKKARTRQRLLISTERGMLRD